MQYMLLIYEDEAIYDTAEKYEAVVAAHEQFAGELARLGVLRGGAGLEPVAKALTIRKVRGKHLVHDGPYAETKEQIGGYYLIDVPDVETALEWARKLPLGGDGSVEVRPLIDTGEARELEEPPAA
ncbi:MAG TPA: YciI family protein [Caulobacteraceae bacterium]|jgi:hypothetical protein